MQRAGEGASAQEVVGVRLVVHEIGNGVRDLVVDLVVERVDLRIDADVGDEEIRVRNAVRIDVLRQRGAVLDGEPVQGRAAIRDTIAGFSGMAEKICFDTLRILADGPIVMTERVDHFVIADRDIGLPVMGVFEVNADGKITAWRDYFDMNQFTSQMSG